MKKAKYQHGDVVLFSIDSIPKTAIKRNLVEKLVVEKGEGVNTHVINDIANIELLEDNDTMYLNVLRELDIDHEEHGKITIEPGFYVKEIERQFDYEKEIERNVID